MLLFTASNCEMNDEEFSIGKDCDCEEELFYYGSIKAKISIAHFLLNNWLYIGFHKEVKDSEIVSFINKSGLFKSVESNQIIHFSPAEQMPTDERNTVSIYVNLKKAKSCSQLKEIISTIEKSSIVDFASLTFWCKGVGVVSDAPYFYVVLKSADDLPYLMSLSEETNTTVLMKPFDHSDYYFVKADKNSKGNTLKMQKYFFETGKFKDVISEFEYLYFRIVNN